MVPKPRTRHEQDLHICAKEYGLEAVFRNGLGKWQKAPPETIMAALEALGAPLGGRDPFVRAALTKVQQAQTEPLPPAVVAWDGKLRSIPLRFPKKLERRPLKLTQIFESGETREWDGAKKFRARGEVKIQNERIISGELGSLGQWPLGLHKLRVEIGDLRREALVIAAPGRLDLSGKGLDRTWGAFIPMYALHSKRSWGAGDFTDLEALADWISGLGGGVVATLPFMASFLGENPHAYSPYSPASRLAWNEFYVDPERTPEFAASREARRLVESAAFRREIARLRSLDQVEYREQMALKRRALEPLARFFFQKAPAERRRRLDQLIEDHPILEEYARFRAVGERFNAPWQTWPKPMRGGHIREGDFDPAARDYHLYVQLIAEEQIGSMAERARSRGPGLYLDLPLGSHPDGFDTWREPDIFARTMNSGSPPDMFFPHGQDWGFPPMHPEALRRAGYGYWIHLLRHQFRHAGILRIDHVMGLHRLYWIPQGARADEGIYAHYNAEELYAILLLEAARANAAVVGEDLGTVPNYVRKMMTKRGLMRMYIMPWETNPRDHPPIHTPPADSVASLGNHDMPPFKSFVEGCDIPGRVAAGVLNDDLVVKEIESRGRLRTTLLKVFKKGKRLEQSLGETEALMSAATLELARGPARVALVNLEDLWLETRPQNTPGTGPELPNWKNRAIRGLEEMMGDEKVEGVLKRVSAERGGKPKRRNRE